MVTCIEREGRDGCSWWWNSICNNKNVLKETKKVCNGELPRIPPRNAG